MKQLMTRVAAAAFLCAGAASAHATPGLDVYVLTAGGSSQFGANGNPFGCSTFAPDGLAGIFGRTLQLGLPTDGSICGVAGDGRAFTAATGSVQTAAQLDVGFGRSPDVRTFSGNAQARAGYGSLGVRAAAIYTGTTDSSVVSGTQAGARQVEEMTFGGAVGNGTYRATFTLDGALFNVGRTDSEIEFGYSFGASPSRMAFRIFNARGVISLYLNGATPVTLLGLTTTGDGVHGFTVAGETSFSIDIPIVFGQAQEVGFSLWGASLPSSSLGLLTPSAGDASFFNTVKLTGIEVLDSSGKAVRDRKSVV